MKLAKVRKGLEVHWVDTGDPRVSLCFKPMGTAQRLEGALLSRVPVNCRECERARLTTRLAFCENVMASAQSPIHIRILSGQGLKPSGGADTIALCGMNVAWDIPGVVNAATMVDSRTCRTCRDRAVEVQRLTP